MEIDDLTIVQELKKGNDAGCALLVDKYQNRLYSWGLKQYEELDPHEILGVVDDTFMKALENIDCFHPKTQNAFRNWIFKIFQNGIIDLLRKAKARSAHIQVHSIDDPPLDGDSDRLGKVQRELDRIIYQDFITPDSPEHPLAKKVNEFVETLGEKSQIILAGCAHGHTHKEIGDWTGIPENHIRVYYSRLKERLRKYLAANGGDPSWKKKRIG